MSTEQFANNAATLLAAPMAPSSPGASETILVGSTGSPFPSNPQFRIKIDSEFLLVTAINSSTSWQVTRGQESTTAASHSNGTPVINIVTKAAIDAAFVRLDTGASQTLTGPLVVPPSIGGTPATTNYGSVPVKINQYSVSGTNQQSITIPTGYTKFVFDCKLRQTTSAGSVDLKVRCNGSSATDYAWERVYLSGAAGTWTSAEGTADTAMSVGFVPGTTPGKGFSFTVIELIDPDDGSNDKSFKSEGTTTNAYTAGNIYVTKASGFWKPASPAAVTSVLIFSGGGENFASTSKIIVWGYP